MNNRLYFAGVLLLAACGSWLGNPKKPGGGTTPTTTATLAIAGQLLPPAAAGLGLNTTAALTTADGGTLTLTTAQVVVKAFTLENQADSAETGNASADPQVQISGSFQGPYVGDLMTSQLSPTPAAITVPAGHFLALQGALAADADGHAIVLKGRFQPATGPERAFSLVVATTQELSFGYDGGTGGFDIVAGQNFKLVAKFKVYDWFKSVSLSSLAATGDIVLQDGQSGDGKTAFDALKANIFGGVGYDHE